MTILIQEYFESNSEERLQEIRETLIKNLENPYITEIYLLNEFEYSFLENLKNQNQKLNVITTGKRLTFKFSIEFANNLKQNQREHKCTQTIILMNNDIYFDINFLDKSFENINDVFLDNPNTVITLSRGDLKHKSSQDIWIFRIPLKITNSNLYNFYFGYLGVDNRFAYLLKNEGYRLRNLPYDIITVHNHKSNYRTYNKDHCVSGPFYEVDVQEIIQPVIKINKSKDLYNLKQIINDTNVIINYRNVK